MRLAHISDLHIGKRVNEISMIKDQRYILDEIIRIINEQQVDAVLIAGDIYDKSMPSAEAVSLCDSFLTKLALTGIHTFIISGNHDCEERVAFGSKVFEAMNIHIAPVFDGKINQYTLCKDDSGNISIVSATSDLKSYSDIVNIFLLPFIKPIGIKHYFEDIQIDNHNDAVKAALSGLTLDTSQCNILVAHQFVAGVKVESDETNVGGLEQVSTQHFDDFDYVALGHIHRPQSVGRTTIRYAGSPLKYSFSEVSHNKCITIVDTHFKDITITQEPLLPLHDMRDVRGTYEEVTNPVNYSQYDTLDYVRVILTDEQDIPDAVSRIRSIYPNVMRLEYDNERTKSYRNLTVEEHIETKSDFELFCDFYEQQNGAPMSDAYQEYIQSIINIQ